MGFLGDIWNGLREGLESLLRLYEGVIEPFAGGYAWGLAIILLTVTVRIFLIPLMVRQTRSMRAMQHLQPQLKKIQEKYKADRSLMKTDPERYKKLKDKQREAQMALYQEHQVNPVGGCLPLILQMPIFLALFQVLQNGRVEELADAPFLGIESLSGTAAGGAGIGAIVLVVLQVATTFYTQKQMQARTASSGGGGDQQAQVQKMMLYIMPVFLGYLSFTFPIGVVLYWVTTNVWTIGQQAYIFKKVEQEEAEAAQARKEKRAASKGSSGKGSSGKGSSGKGSSGKGSSGKGSSGKGSSGKGSSGKGSSGNAPKGSGSKGDASKGDGSKGDGSKGDASKGVSAADDQSAEIVADDEASSETTGNGSRSPKRSGGTKPDRT